MGGFVVGPDGGLWFNEGVDMGGQQPPSLPPDAHATEPFGPYAPPEEVAQGGITGPPSESTGSSGSWMPGANGDGGTQTPANRENQLLNPNGLPVPLWTPHGTNPVNNPLTPVGFMAQVNANVAAFSAREEAAQQAVALSTPPVFRVPWWVQQAKADKYQTMPTKHPTGRQVDPYFETAPSVDWTNDYNIMNSPYEYENWPFPDNQITPIGDVVTFPGNPANDNNPTGPGGAPHNWDNYRRQAALARAIARALQGNLGQDHFFGP